MRRLVVESEDRDANHHPHELKHLIDQLSLNSRNVNPCSTDDGYERVVADRTVNANDQLLRNSDPVGDASHGEFERDELRGGQFPSSGQLRPRARPEAVFTHPDVR